MLSISHIYSKSDTTKEFSIKNEKIFEYNMLDVVVKNIDEMTWSLLDTISMLLCNITKMCIY